MSKRDVPSGSPAAESEAERTFVMERTFDVPASVIFAAYQRPELLKRWFGPPDYPLTLVEIDFRVGGRYRFAMTGPDGTQNTPFGGAYLEIVPDRRIVYSNAFEEAGAETMIVTVDLEETKGRTRLVLTTLFGSVAMKELHLGYGYAQGSNAAYDQLVALAKEIAS